MGGLKGTLKSVLLSRKPLGCQHRWWYPGSCVLSLRQSSCGSGLESLFDQRFHFEIVPYSPLGSCDVPAILVWPTPLTCWSGKVLFLGFPDDPSVRENHWLSSCPTPELAGFGSSCFRSWRPNCRLAQAKAAINAAQSRTSAYTVPPGARNTGSASQRRPVSTCSGPLGLDLPHSGFCTRSSSAKLSLNHCDFFPLLQKDPEPLLSPIGEIVPFSGESVPCLVSGCFKRTSTAMGYPYFSTKRSRTVAGYFLGKSTILSRSVSAMLLIFSSGIFAMDERTGGEFVDVAYAKLLHRSAYSNERDNYIAVIL